MGRMLGIRIKKYGSLNDIQMGKVYSNRNPDALGNINAIIGQSGTGKSTLADAFGFIADSLNEGVEIACDLHKRGGFERLRSQGKGGPIEFELYYRETSNSSPITYELSVDLDKKKRPYVVKERLRQRRAGETTGQPLIFLSLENGKGFAFKGKNSGLDEADSTKETGERVDVYLNDIRQLGIVTLGELREHPRIVNFKIFLKNWYLCYFSPSSAREIPNAGPQKYLNKTGDNLNNVAQFLQREDPKEFLRVLKEIQTKLSGIEEIKPVEMANGQLVLQFNEHGFKNPFFSQKMSDGTLKLFAYYLLLHEKDPRPLVFIEEPENGLYHKYLADLAMEMKECVGSGFAKQLFVTTHSPFFVNALHPSEVWVLEKGDDSFSTMKRASDYQHVKALYDEEVQLGDLWYSDYFG